MRRQSICILSLLLVVMVTVNTVHAVGPSSSFDISGAYYFVDKAPQEFRDVDWIALFTSDAAGRKIPLHGYIRLKNRYRGRYVNFSLVRATLKGPAISFSTTVVRGTSFTFKGEFLKLDDLQDNETVLRGLLTKFRNGRKVAEFNSRYSYYAGD